tara:strand:+ start:1427 stop:2218 length:792 start_codon:yes stop_codon:yes gene_type:complete
MGFWSSLKNKLSKDSYADIASATRLKKEEAKVRAGDLAAAREREAVESSAELQVRSLAAAVQQFNDEAKVEQGLLMKARSELDGAFLHINLTHRVQRIQNFIDKLHEDSIRLLELDRRAQVIHGQIMNQSLASGKISKGTWKILRDTADDIQKSAAHLAKEFDTATVLARQQRAQLAGELEKAKKSSRMLDEWLKRYPNFKSIQTSLISEIEETVKNAKSAAGPGLTDRQARRGSQAVRRALDNQHRRRERLANNMRLLGQKH